MNGAKVIKNINKKNKGSITVEAAIVLPMFILAVFFLAYLIRIFSIYNIIQNSLVEATRKVGNMSYFYHLCGLKEYSDELNDASKEAETTVSNQFDVFQNAFTSFNEIISGVSGEGSNNDNIYDIINGINLNNDNSSEISELINSIGSDPKKEIELFSTIFKQRFSYEINNKLICVITKALFSKELDIRTNSSNGEGAGRLGVESGIKGIDFKESSVFGDNESLEFVIHYKIKVPLLSNVRLSNRVKYIAWTGGRGESGKTKNDNNTEESVWTQCDNNKQYWQRGSIIEKGEVDKIIKEASKGSIASSTPSKYPAIDAYVYNKADKTIEFYDVFTLNPFLKTFSQRPNEIGKQIKKHGANLSDFEGSDILENIEVKKIKRILIVVIPENSQEYVIDAYQSAKAQIEKMNIEVRLVRGYGEYQYPEAEQKDQVYERSRKNEYRG